MRIIVRIRSMGETVCVAPYLTQDEFEKLTHIGTEIDDESTVHACIAELASSFVDENFGCHEADLKDWRRRDLLGQVKLGMTSAVDDLRADRGASCILPDDRDA